jgi:hypothetical protein
MQLTQKSVRGYAFHSHVLGALVDASQLSSRPNRLPAAFLDKRRGAAVGWSLDTVAARTYLRRAIPILAVVIVAVAAYDAWIFYSRRASEREIERKMTRAKAEEARQTIEMLGGDHLKILSFYAAPAVLQRGQSASLCFGVNGAKSVRIEPPVVDDLHPSISRCFQISPREDTEYTLTAVDPAGRSLTQSLLLRVR